MSINSVTTSFALHRISDDTDVDDDDHDKYSDVSTDPFHQSEATSRTSVSMRSPSPTESVYSLTSSLRAQSYRYEHGRGVNNYSEVYRLPADDEEIDRLDYQHDMFKKIIGRYPPPMTEIMKDTTPGETKAILDLGCGSGSWIMEAAREWPDCNAVAVDLVPMQSLTMPANCRSEVDDINLGLEHFYGDFDVVHARLICTGIKDYEALIDQISGVLRPGGLLEMMEFGFQVHDENKRPYQVSAAVMEAPYLPRWLSMARMAATQRGGTVDAARKIHGWLLNNPAFEDVVYRPFWAPVSPWVKGDDEESKKLRDWGQTMIIDFKSFLNAARPLLLGSGLPLAYVDELEGHARRELDEAQIPYYFLLDNFYARRKRE